MSVPQSLLVVALAVAWLIVLVPSSARRRGRVPETVEGNGFRVLRRPEVPRSRLIRQAKRKSADAVSVANLDSEGQMTSQRTDVDDIRADDDTVVLDAVPANSEATDSQSGLPDDDRGELTEDQRSDDNLDHRDDDDDVEYRDDAIDGQLEPAQDDLDDDEQLRAEYQAWRQTTRTPEQPEAAADNVRPIPRRPGRGTYDPDAAERARAYKYSRRRRAVLILVLLVVGFTVAAVMISSKLWIGVGVSAVLLVLFMAYLRRQVKIEADIRERRLAKLQRARQIRPERPQTAERTGDPYAQRAPRPRQAAGPEHHRVNRVVVDLDDDDPGFDDLEQYEPMEYRRAVGQ